MVVIVRCFHNGQHKYLISVYTWKTGDPNFRGVVCSVSPSLHHFVLGSVSTFKYDDVSMLKTFMHGHSCVMTFLHLKVPNA